MRPHLHACCASSATARVVHTVPAASGPLQPQAQGQGRPQATHWSLLALPGRLQTRLPAGKARVWVAGRSRCGGGRHSSHPASQQSLNAASPCSSSLLQLCRSMEDLNLKLFCAPARLLLPMQARPDVTVTSREIASAAGAAWRALAPDLKHRYEARGDAEKVRAIDHNRQGCWSVCLRKL